jgi:hypothetical protein
VLYPLGARAVVVGRRFGVGGMGHPRQTIDDTRAFECTKIAKAESQSTQ